MKRPSATLIGVFVLGALALIAAAILFFGGGALFKQRFTAVSYFPGSVAGLQIGAPVTYRGVRVGQVKSIGIRIDPEPTHSIVQVNMELVPEAVQRHGNSSTQEALPALVERGLTAQLVLQSFVTGMLQVELDFRPGVKALRLGESLDLPEIPTVASPFQALTDQLQTLDIAAAVTALQRTLASMDALLTNPALKQTIDGLPALARRSTSDREDGRPRSAQFFHHWTAVNLRDCRIAAEHARFGSKAGTRRRSRGSEHADCRARHSAERGHCSRRHQGAGRPARPNRNCRYRTHWATSRQPQPACAIYQSG